MSSIGLQAGLNSTSGILSEGQSGSVQRPFKCGVTAGLWLTGRPGAWELLATPPLSNPITLYATVMIPGTGKMETRVPRMESQSADTLMTMDGEPVGLLARDAKVG